MSSVACFWTEPTDTAEESFRRFVFEAKCAGKSGYHTASVYLGIAPWHDGELYGCGDLPSEELRRDPRWPTSCSCGYAFRPADEWQHNLDRQFRRVDTGERFTIRSAPAGAMWDAKWWNEPGPDGITLCVKLPDGCDWMVDGPASNGGRWTRTGTVPNISASPSILTDRYHGFLTGGVLVSC